MARSISFQLGFETQYGLHSPAPAASTTPGSAILPEYWEALHPYNLQGAYINFMMEEGEERIRATYGENYERLVAIKKKYDPTNFFRVNQNIKPPASICFEADRISQRL